MLIGQDGADYLYGEDDADILWGDDNRDLTISGDDYLAGGKGKDTLLTKNPIRQHVYNQ